MTRHVGGLDFRPGGPRDATDIRTLADRYARASLDECLSHWRNRHEDFGREFARWLGASGVYYTGVPHGQDPTHVFTDAWRDLIAEHYRLLREGS